MLWGGMQGKRFWGLHGTHCGMPRKGDKGGKWKGFR